MKSLFELAMLLLAAVAPFQGAFGSAVDAEPRRAPSSHAAITRGPVTNRSIALCFTAHEFAEGGELILRTLAGHGARASFFLTGDFLANTNFASLIQRMMLEGHYVGPHSDKHLLYCSWDASRKTLVSQSEFSEDLDRNIEKIHAFQVAATKEGVAKEKLRPTRFFLPPFEHYNTNILLWTTQKGLVLVNYTPGTRSNADYTGERDRNFVPSSTIFESILARERQDTNGLNGFLLLLHLGAGPGREDKFHSRFPDLMKALAGKGYKFVTVDELLEPKDQASAH